MRIYKSLLETIGNTPLIELSNFKEKHNLNAQIIAKVESFNPGGSIKDRTAMSMLFDAQLIGLINKDTTIVEPTSGNTGIGLALACACLNLKCILTLPESMSKERRALLKAYGAQLELTPKEQGMQGAVDRAKEIAKSLDNAFIPSQFDNEANPRIHALTTGPEILNDTEGKVDLIVSGIGTGGTISGLGSFFKQQKKKVKIVGVEPASSPLLTKGYAGPHKIQGIGANFVPSILDKEVIDEILAIEDDEAMQTCAEVCRLEGLFCGISSGAALNAAIKLARREENFGKMIVVIIPDSGDRYLSTGIFD